MSNDLCISSSLFLSRRMQRYLRASDGGSVCSFCVRVICFIHLGSILWFCDARYFSIFFGVDIRSFNQRLHNLNTCPSHVVKILG